MSGRFVDSVQIGRISVSIVKGDITKQRADVIVNTTNASLELDSGPVSKAILSAAGDTIQDECDEKYPNDINQGYVAVTGPGELNCSHLFHVFIKPYGKNEDVENVDITFKSCLQKAERMKLKSVAFPAVGTGSQGYPPNVVSNSLFDTVEQYNKDNRNTKINSVICVVFQAQHYQIFVNEATKIAAARKQCRGYFQIGKTAISIVKGNIVKQQVDVIVNTTSADLDMNAGPVSKAILAAAGDSILEECNDLNCRIVVGDVAVTGSGMLDCENVFHVYIPKYSKHEDIGNVDKTLQACLEKAESMGLQSIAIPALGTGNQRYPPDDVSKSLFDTIENYTNDNTNTNIELVICVVFQDQHFQTFVAEARNRAASKGNEQRRIMRKVLNKTTISSTTLTLLVGNITEEQADVLVHTFPHNLKLGNSTKLSEAILNAAGRSIQDELDRQYQNPNSVQTGDFAVTNGFRLPCKKVYHGKVLDFMANNTNESPRKVLKTLVKSCLSVASRFGTKSVVFPALGTGELKFPPDIAASSVIGGILSFLRDNKRTSISEIRVVVYGGNTMWSSISKAYCAELTQRQAGSRALSSIPTRKGTKQYFRAKFKEEPTPPRNWTHFTSQKTLKTWIAERGKNKCHHVQLDQQTFNAIKNLFLQTIGFLNVQIVSIMRIENASLFLDYFHQCQNMYDRAIANGSFKPFSQTPGSTGAVTTLQHVNKHLGDLLDPTLNEVYLFHGTKMERVNVLLQNGFDPRLAAMNFAKLWLGAGIYSAEEANLSNRYVDQNGERSMFVMRVCLGDVFTTTAQMTDLKRPPCKALCSGVCTAHTEFFDSVVGELSPQFSQREFVVYDRTKCYPEYLIKYKL